VKQISDLKGEVVQFPRDSRHISIKYVNTCNIHFGNTMMKKMNIGTAGIIRKDEKILIAQRKKDSWMEPNKWEFPGGKVEQNETYEECLIREIQEELGITITIDRLFMKTTHIYMKNHEEFPVTLMVFLADWKDGKRRNIDCQDSKWIDKNEFKKFDFAAADVPIVEKFLEFTS
jgi:8-oxo-dGTP diphosphatase